MLSQFLARSLRVMEHCISKASKAAVVPLSHDGDGQRDESAQVAETEDPLGVWKQLRIGADCPALTPRCGRDELVSVQPTEAVGVSSRSGRDELPTEAVEGFFRSGRDELVSVQPTEAVEGFFRSGRNELVSVQPTEAIGGRPAVVGTSWTRSRGPQIRLEVAPVVVGTSWSRSRCPQRRVEVEMVARPL